MIERLANRSKLVRVLIDKAQKLHCDDQFAIATAVAANVGYILVPEPTLDDGGKYKQGVRA